MRYDTNDVTIDDLRAVAIQILRQQPDPPVRIRLLRDVLCVPADDGRLTAAQDDLRAGEGVRLLASEQRHDGSWGRLHSRDTKARQRVPTTERAVERAVALGLSSDHPILRRATDYLADVVSGRVQPIDPPETNDRWAAGVRLFAATTLSLIEPHHPALDAAWATWCEVLETTFSHGAYDAEAETQAQKRLQGATAENSYLNLSSRYALTLLSARADGLREDVVDLLLTWVGRKEDGVGSLGEQLDHPPQRTAGSIERWIQSWEILGRFPLKPRRTRDVLDWLDETSDEDGFWDLGRRAACTVMLPLSEDWRVKGTRRIDWTTRLLVLQSALVR